MVARSYGAHNIFSEIRQIKSNDEYTLPVWTRLAISSTVNRRRSYLILFRPTGNNGIDGLMSMDAQDRLKPTKTFEKCETRRKPIKSIRKFPFNKIEYTRVANSPFYTKQPISNVRQRLSLFWYITTPLNVFP